MYRAHTLTFTVNILVMYCILNLIEWIDVIFNPPKARCLGSQPHLVLMLARYVFISLQLFEDVPFFDYDGIVIQ